MSLRLASLALVVVALAGCGKSSSSGGAHVSLDGAGATFPYPLYSKWMAEYAKRDPSVKLNYQSIGSGGGIRQITEKTVDFGASDAPMTDEQLAKTGGPLLHVPTTIGAVVVTHSVPGLATLRLDGDTLAGIFLGEIETWDDPKLKALNPDATLPSKPIAVVHRTDGSGTTAVFTDYLSAVSPVWKTKVGKGTSVAFPTGLGAKGNEGVTGQVKSTPDAIGYVELAYAIQNQLPVATLKNHAGKFVDPSIDAITAAAAGFAGKIPDDLRVSIVDAPGDAAYPIASFTYVLVYQHQTDAAKGEALVKFLWWATHDGQSLAKPLDFAPLPDDVVKRDETKLRSIDAAGKPLLAAGG